MYLKGCMNKASHTHELHIGHGITQRTCASCGWCRGRPYNGSDPVPDNECIVPCGNAANGGCHALPHVQLFNVIVDESERRDLASTMPDKVGMHSNVTQRKCHSQSGEENAVLLSVCFVTACVPSKLSRARRPLLRVYNRDKVHSYCIHIVSILLVLKFINSFVSQNSATGPISNTHVLHPGFLPEKGDSCSHIHNFSHVGRARCLT